MAAFQVILLIRIVLLMDKALVNLGSAPKQFCEDYFEKTALNGVVYDFLVNYILRHEHQFVGCER